MKPLPVMDHPRPLVILGAAKAGTTSLHELLLRHPAIHPFSRKELHYFDVVDEPTRTDYFAHASEGLPPSSGNTWLLEATPSYLRLPFVPPRIAAVIPDAKLIAVLREPVSRAHADWFMHTTNGDERRSFMEAAIEELRAPVFAQLASDPHLCRALWLRHLRSLGTGLIQATTYLIGGLYADQLTEYLRVFDRRQILVLFFEELIQDPDAAAVQIGHFLDLDPAPILGGLPKVNQALGQRTAKMARPLMRPQTRRVLRRTIPAAVRRHVKNGIRHFDRPPELDQAAAEMLAQYYKEPNERLGELLQRSLPWGHHRVNTS